MLCIIDLILMDLNVLACINFNILYVPAVLEIFNNTNLKTLKHPGFGHHWSLVPKSWILKLWIPPKWSYLTQGNEDWLVCSGYVRSCYNFNNMKGNSFI